MIASLLVLMLQPEGLPTCDQEKVDQGIQQEMNICAANDFYEADAELNAVWPIVRDRMKLRDEAANSTGLPDWDERPGYFDTVLAAQRAWLTYRDAHCRSEGYFARGGTLEPLLVSVCKTHLTKLRTQELRELAETR